MSWRTLPQSLGLYRRLSVHTLQDAREHGLHSIFAFTYVDRFFAKMGYHLVDRGDLPLKAWKDCLRCPKFQACDEIAVLKQFKPAPPSRLQNDIFRLFSADSAPKVAP